MALASPNTFGFIAYVIPGSRRQLIYMRILYFEMIRDKGTTKIVPLQTSHYVLARDVRLLYGE